MSVATVRRTLALGVLASVCVTACGTVPSLEHTSSSAEALAAAVLEALARRDRSALERMALGEREFRDHVWPQLPAARPERNLPFSYVWGDLHQKSMAALSETLARHGGRRYALLDIAFDDDTNYGAYRVHRHAALHVRDPQGKDMLLRICGSMVEKGGVWKIFSYVID